MTPLQESLSKCKIKNNVLYLPNQDEYKLTNYNEVKKALMNAGAEYKRNTFVFPNDAQPYIDRLMGGESVNIKKEFQFFGTPKNLAERLVKLAKIKLTDKLCEPEAGQGAIIDEIILQHPSNDIFICEKMDINLRILSKKYKDNSHVYFCHPLNDDFLEFDGGGFDKIIANPPFQNNQDISHIKKMYEVLAPEGRLVSMASKHWQLSKNRKETEFRNWLNKVNAEIIEVRAGTFKESGTNIAAVIIVIDKNER